MSGARLTILDYGGRRMGDGLADQDGLYRLPVPPTGEYAVLASTVGHLPQVVEIVVERPRGTEPAPRPARAAVVRGTVTEDCLRMPVPEALVVFVDAGGMVVGSTLTSAEGCYEYRGLAPGSYGVAVLHRQYEPLVRQLAVSGADPEPVDIELTRRLLTFSGVVRDADGRSVPGVPVRLADGSGCDLREDADDEGRFAFSAVPLGMYSLLVEDPPVTGERVLVDRDRCDAQVILRRDTAR